ncbi:hypothetical protein [Paenibacillus sp.]|uniref:hypothetical protein n=1 Tax=Paenibacillus sp. TaxID=58172 RepID=UPI0028AFE466|nr:hypothetical protein [Paenibacillus sp.]
MTKLFLHSREMKSVFQLLSEHENDITYSGVVVLMKSELECRSNMLPEHHFYKVNVLSSD